MNLYEVIFIPFPFKENPQLFKRRPAVIIRIDNDFIKVAKITKQVDKSLKHNKHCIVISKGTFESMAIPLDYDSVIVLDHIISIPKQLYIPLNKTCFPKTVIDRIEECLMKNPYLLNS